MEILVHFSGVPVTLETNGFSGRIDIDQLTSIDYGNLYGEAVTVSARLIRSVNGDSKPTPTKESSVLRVSG